VVGLQFGQLLGDHNRTVGLAGVQIALDVPAKYADFLIMGGTKSGDCRHRGDVELVQGTVPGSSADANGGVGRESKAQSASAGGNF